MFKNAKRIFMSEADGTGSGAAPAVPVEPTASPPAPVATQAVTLDQVKSLMTETLGGFKNALFAEARRAGMLGKEKPVETPATPQPAPVAASQTLSMADVQALLDQDRVITRAQIENKLTDAQVKRMRSALQAEKPDDVSNWASTYLTDMGLVKALESSNPVTPVPQPQPNGAPISDKGSPAPGNGANWHREFADNPLNMSAAAKAAMDAELGEGQARKKRIEAAQRIGAQLRVTPR